MLEDVIEGRVTLLRSRAKRNVDSSVVELSSLALTLEDASRSDWLEAWEDADEFDEFQELPPNMVLDAPLIRDWLTRHTQAWFSVVLSETNDAISVAVISSNSPPIDRPIQVPSENDVFWLVLESVVELPQAYDEPDDTSIQNVQVRRRNSTNSFLRECDAQLRLLVDVSDVARYAALRLQEVIERTEPVRWGNASS
jgi:hypothetical protein